MAKLIKTFSVLILSIMPYLTCAEHYEIEIHGMTCSFCVHALKKKLDVLPGIEHVEVSLRHKKVRLKAKNDETDLDAIKTTIVDAGFTPVSVKQLPDEK